MALSRSANGSVSSATTAFRSPFPPTHPGSQAAGQSPYGGQRPSGAPYTRSSFNYDESTIQRSQRAGLTPSQNQTNTGTSNDLSDFPALGSVSFTGLSNVTNPHHTNHPNASSTAAQVAAGNPGNPTSSEFGPDDFPALNAPSLPDGQSPGALNAYLQEPQRQNSVSGVTASNLSREPASQESPTRKESKGQINNEYANWPNFQATESSMSTQTSLNAAHRTQTSQIPPSSTTDATAISNGSLPEGSHPMIPQRPLSRSANGEFSSQNAAQQIVISAADRWGLYDILRMIRSVDPDTAMFGMGTDLSLAGFDMTTPDRTLAPYLVTPWSTSSAAQLVEPDFVLPSCYAVATSPPGPAKAQAFSDEALLMMFYASPKDVLQEIAAQELFNRSWRYHKEARLWLTKESGTPPSHKGQTYERGIYTFFDPENWERSKKEATISYTDLEEKSLASLTAIHNGSSGVSMTGHGLHQHSQQASGHHPHPQSQMLPESLRHRQEVQLTGRYDARSRTPGLGTTL